MRIYSLLLLAVLVAACSSSKPQRFHASDVLAERVVLAQYLDDRAAGLPFETEWYDQATAFARMDTLRGKFYLASLTDFRPLDSLGIITPNEFRMKRRILEHVLNVLLTTADSLQ